MRHRGELGRAASVGSAQRLTRAELIEHNVIDANAYPEFATLTDAGFKVVIERGGIHASLVVHQA